MTTICLLPGIAASLLPFHRDFRSSCAIFRRPRKPQKRRPDGFTTVYSCESSASCAARRRPPENRKKAPGWVLPNPALRGFRRRFRRPPENRKKAPGRVLKDPTLRDFRSSCGYLPAPHCETAKKAPGWVLKDPALRGFRRRFCTASIHRGQLSEPCEARRVCPNGCEKGVRKRQETQQVDRENPSGRREYRKAPGDYSVMEANSCRNAEFQ